MKPRLTVFLGCAWIALVVGGALGADSEREKEKLQGTWKSFSFKGTGLPDNSKTVTMVFDDDKILVTINGIPYTYEFALDVDTSPKQIDLTPMMGMAKLFQQVDKGIYSIDGDELTVCFGGQLRPLKFELRPKTNDALIKLKRERSTAPKR